MKKSGKNIKEHAIDWKFQRNSSTSKNDGINRQSGEFNTNTHLYNYESSHWLMEWKEMRNHAFELLEFDDEKKEKKTQQSVRIIELQQFGIL